jgi:type I restriction enzyme M protein
MAKTTSSPTTAQSLGSLIKSARDIMRKDKGLNGDLDRLPVLTWIMFLKFLDNLETQRETEASLAGNKFERAIDPPYRWRDWAAKEEGITGDELISFVNNEEAVLPDGKRGPGLFAYLRGLTGKNGGDRRDVIATVFKGTINRMINGYLLRDVITRSREFISVRARNCTRSARFMKRCCVKCAMPPGTQASFIRRVQLFASWSR